MREIGRALPGKNLERQVGGLDALLSETIHVAADDASTEQRGRWRIGRSRGRPSDIRSDLGSDALKTQAIVEDGHEHHDGIARKLRRSLQQRVVAQANQMFDVVLVRKWLQGGHRVRMPGAVACRSARYE